MRTTALALALTLAIASATITHASAPQRVTIFTGKAASKMLEQCSRGTPQKGSGWFRPTRQQIDALDRATARDLAKLTWPRDRVKVSNVATLRREYAVEVVGIVRDGQRFVYGNYFPLTFYDGVKEAATSPTIVCDGGPRLFGVEIDARTGSLTHIAFNGRF